MDADQVSLHPVRSGRRRVCRWGRDRWALVALILLAWALRVLPALENRFHPDEALYGHWGLLIARGSDLWLAGVSVDKPPLLPYLLAGAQVLFGSPIGGPQGNSEFIVRFPGLVAGLLTVPLTATLAYSLYRDRGTAAAAAVGVALSPFAILFSGTIFTDPVMVTLGLAACVVVACGRSGWAGLLAGLALATKQAGLVWLPLVIAIQVSSPKSQVSSLSRFLSAISVIGHLSLVIGVMLVWDMMRVGWGAESFWRSGVASYGGLRLIWPAELWVRLRGWLELARYLFVSPLVNGLLLVGLPVLAWRGAPHRVRIPNSKPQIPKYSHQARGSLIDLVLASFCLIYLLAHWLWAFPVWDRYLLPLVPVLAVLIGRVLILLASYVRVAICNSRFATRNSLFVICHLSLVICLASPAFNAAQSGYPVGGDHWAYDGIDKVVAFLRNLPEGTVVYQHWLGWHYAYHLFDAPIYLAYWPTPAWLARDVWAFGTREPRYITFPSWESSARVERALAEVGYELEPVLATAHRDGTSSFAVYHIQPLADQ